MEKTLTEQESLHLITSMIQKAKAGYHERGTGAIMWGAVVAFASLVKYFEITYKFKLPFDIFLIVLAAIIPQIIISNKEAKENKVKRFEDGAVNAAWLVYGLTIFGLIFYSNVIGTASLTLMEQEGYELIKHYTTQNKPNEIIKPFVPSTYSLYILLYAMPTLITGIAKKFTPMVIGAIITYILFGISCYTSTAYDMLLGAIAAIVCWLIPGIILRKKYLADLRNKHV
jgi:hypothetical protein